MTLETRIAAAPDELNNMLSSRRRDDIWLWFGLAAAALILVPTLALPFSYDHGFFHYMAAAAMRGYWPYLDAWDSAFPPGILAVHAIPLWLGSVSPAAFRGLDLLVQLLVCGLLALLADDRRAGGIAAILYALAYSSGGYHHTAQRDGFLLLPLLGALHFLRKRLAGSDYRFTVAAGSAFGAVCLLRPTYVILLVVLTAYFVWRRPSRATLHDVGLLWGCTVAPIALFIGVYWTAGHLPALQDTVEYLWNVHPHIERAGAVSVLVASIRYAPGSIILGVCIWALISRRVSSEIQFIAVLCVVACVVIRLVESKVYLYQFWPLYCASAFLAGHAYAALWTSTLSRLGRNTACAFAVVVGFWIAYGVGGHRIVSDYRSFGGRLMESLRASDRSLIPDSDDQQRIAEWLRRNSVAEDLVQPWGPGPMLLIAVQRLAPTRFIDTKGFLCTDGQFGDQPRLVNDCAPNRRPGVQLRFEREFLEAMDRRRPRWIVARAGPSLQVFTPPFFAPDFPALRDVISRDYQCAVTFGQWAVYRRRS
jgi:hypothetical protein